MPGRRDLLQKPAAVGGPAAVAVRDRPRGQRGRLESDVAGDGRGQRQEGHEQRVAVVADDAKEVLRAAGDDERHGNLDEKRDEQRNVPLRKGPPPGPRGGVAPVLLVLLLEIVGALGPDAAEDAVDLRVQPAQHVFGRRRVQRSEAAPAAIDGCRRARRFLNRRGLLREEPLLHGGGVAEAILGNLAGVGEPTMGREEGSHAAGSRSLEAKA
mmetsp:Transcript_19115/g.50513  ORF Transcript_19115/g.50513 Transcript_19115/m.50513 type:complete len:212 (+) Transcript_19115:313-948(+)